MWCRLFCLTYKMAGFGIRIALTSFIAKFSILSLFSGYWLYSFNLVPNLVLQSLHRPSFKSTNENMKLYKMNETYILYRDYVPLIMMEITNKSLNHYLVELNGMWMYYTANRQPGSGQHQLRSAVQLTQIAWGNQTQKQLQKFELLRSRNCIALLVVWQAECWVICSAWMPYGLDKHNTCVSTYNPFASWWSETFSGLSAQSPTSNQQ